MPEKMVSSTMKRKITNELEQSTAKRRRLDHEEQLDKEAKPVSDGDSSDDEGEEGDAEGSSNSSGEEEAIEYLASTRDRRANAGARMSQLIESADQDDAFYRNSAYGSFYEDDDENFDSPVEESDGDDVDSDFDRPEDEDEDEAGASDQETAGRRKKAKKRSGSREARREVRKHRKWMIPRLSTFPMKSRPANPFSQEELLDEAKHTEKRNTESLQIQERLAVEQRRDRERTARLRSAARFSGPSIRYVDSAERRFVVLPSLPPPRPRPRPSRGQLCVVTGLRARYRDPLTGLPYANADAFAQIRKQYLEFVKRSQQQRQRRLTQSDPAAAAASVIGGVGD